MQPTKTTSPGKPEPNLRPADPEHVKEAHQQADADIDNDPDFMPGNEADDLDEEEAVKLNDDENDLV